MRIVGNHFERQSVFVALELERGELPKLLFYKFLYGMIYTNDNKVKFFKH